jgi:hypothetical protein
LFLGALLVQIEEVASHNPFMQIPQYLRLGFQLVQEPGKMTHHKLIGSLNGKLVTIFPIAVSLITS